jgi:DNA-directed RNA polymerase subunit RPC12/RpoP
MSFETQKGKVTIPKVPRQRCNNCGEQFFDHESNIVLDRYRGKIKTKEIEPIVETKKFEISECPMCGSKRIVRETGEFDGFRIPGIEYEHCKSCGEKFYDPDASRAIDDALRAAGRLKKRPARYSLPKTASIAVQDKESGKKYGKRKSRE